MFFFSDTICIISIYFKVIAVCLYIPFKISDFYRHIDVEMMHNINLAFGYRRMSVYSF